MLELTLLKSEQIKIMKRLEGLSLDMRKLSAIAYEKPFSLEVSKEFKRVESELRDAHIQYLQMVQESIKKAKTI